LHEGQDVALAVTDLHDPGRGQLSRSLGQTLVAFEPARAFADATALAVGTDGSVRALPEPGAKRDASGTPLDGVVGSIGETV